TVAGLAAVADTTRVVVAEQGAVEGGARLTPIQARFFERVGVAPHHFNQSVLLEAGGGLDLGALERVVEALTRQHDALRMRFVRDEEGAWGAYNAAAEHARVVTLIDLSEAGDEERRRALLEACAAEAQQSLSLAEGPLLRVLLFEGGEGLGVRLLLVIHHLVVDGVSWRILLEDLQRGYGQAVGGVPVELGAKGTSWREWAERQHGYAATAEAELEAEYWAGEVEGERALLPRDFEGGARLMSGAEVVTTWLDERQTQALLTEVPAVYRTQINDVLLAALAETLAQWSGDSRIVIELEGHGREELFEGVDVTRTVGWFTSRFPVALETMAGAGAAERLRRVKEKLRAVPKKGVGYGVLKFMGASEALRGAQEGEVSFNYLGQFDAVLGDGGLLKGAKESAGASRDGRQERAQLLEVSGGVGGGRLQMNWRYGRETHARATVEKLAGEYMRSVERIVEQSRTEGEVEYGAGDFELAEMSVSEVREVAGGRRDIEDIYPLSPMQQGMLFYSLYAPHSGMYAEQMSCTLYGELNVEAFEQAWRTVVERHPVLRTAFAWESLDKPAQVVRRNVRLPLEKYDWSSLPPPEQKTRLEQCLDEDRYRGFDLSQSPLMRLKLIRLSDDSHHFVWNHHHLLLDGWSAAAVRKEVFAFYEAACHGVELPMGRPRPYRDYIAWLRQQDMSEAESFWRKALEGFTTPTSLTMDRDPGSVADPDDNRGHARLRLSKEITGGLQALAQRHQLTINTIVQGVWALLLSRYSGRPDVVLGAVVSGRPPSLLGVEKMVGLFMNALPVRVRVKPDEALIAWLVNLQAELADLRQYEHSPLAQVQRWSEVPRGTQLFETIFVFDNYPVEKIMAERESSLEIRDYVSFEKTNYPITVVVAPMEELGLRISYYRSRFEVADVERMLAHFELLLTNIALRPGVQVKALYDLLDELERQQLMVRQRELEETSTRKLSRSRRKAIVNVPAIETKGEDVLKSPDSVGPAEDELVARPLFTLNDPSS
ncbi:MAG: condensation domain-containing protein, partial [Pyrinomonadaceae bacterium]